MENKETYTHKEVEKMLTVIHAYSKLEGHFIAKMGEKNVLENKTLKEWCIDDYEEMIKMQISFCKEVVPKDFIEKFKIDDFSAYIKGQICEYKKKMEKQYQDLKKKCLKP